MLFCAKCGASIPDAATSCPQCGASTAQPASVPPPAPAAPPQAWQTPSPQPQVYSGPQQTDGKAVGSLILGILSLLCFSILAGIPAVVLGHLSKSNIAKSMGRLKGDGMATAGLIMGYLSVASIPIILIIAAIAIPNLLRTRMAANEAVAASTVRKLNTAQVTYATTYPSSGYAASLAVLGYGEAPVDCANASNIDAQHACLIENILACSGTWCTKSGYRFNTTAICGDERICTDYVITATPVAPGSTGAKSFCSTTDAIIRVQRRGPVLTPLTLEECRSWPMVE